VGNEGAGLSRAVLEASTLRARIPMPGRIESLNAATAGSIALFEAVRQRGAR
jgi:TrmH family RNA methyltransferase